MPPPLQQPPLRQTDDDAARTAINGHRRSRGSRGTEESEYGDQYEPSQEQFQLSPRSGPRRVRGGSTFFVSADERPNVEPERLVRSLALSSDIRPSLSEPEPLAQNTARQDHQPLRRGGEGNARESAEVAPHMPPPQQQLPMHQTDDGAARTATNGHRRSRGSHGTGEFEYGEQFELTQGQFQLSPHSGSRRVRGGSAFFVSSDERPNIEPERLARSLVLSSDIRPSDP